ncbi:MAG: tetratricopeptide repeat protein [Methyloprofundus sp.]|nr:tetratricopeptide repeat protein [Methyloprofundus sp.]
MEIYETEEEQVAALKDWWKGNGTSVITGVIAAVVIVAGWNFWQSYQKDKMNQASSMYEQLLLAQKSGKVESVDKIATKLGKEHGSTAYSSYALLFQAKAKVEQQDLSAAKSLLQQAVAISDDAELKHVARTRLIRVLLALQEYEQGLQLIADVDQSSLGGFEAIYAELKGDLYVAMARIGEARTAYQSALKAGQSSPLLQFKLDDLTATDEVDG